MNKKTLAVIQEQMNNREKVLGQKRKQRSLSVIVKALLQLMINMLCKH